MTLLRAINTNNNNASRALQGTKPIEEYGPSKLDMPQSTENCCQDWIGLLFMLATGQLESRSSKDMTKFIKILYLNEK
jgi:hypothetical protein